MPHDFRSTLDNGIAIPACPLALTSERTFDGESQRRLLRYYSAAGAGGIAIGVHTTQFAIRDAKYGLYEPVLRLAAEEMDRIDEGRKPRSCASAASAATPDRPCTRPRPLGNLVITRGC